MLPRTQGLYRKLNKEGQVKKKCGLPSLDLAWQKHVSWGSQREQKVTPVEQEVLLHRISLNPEARGSGWRTPVSLLSFYASGSQNYIHSCYLEPQFPVKPTMGSG